VLSEKLLHPDIKSIKELVEKNGEENIFNLMKVAVDYKKDYPVFLNKMISILQNTDKKDYEGSFCMFNSPTSPLKKQNRGLNLELDYPSCKQYKVSTSFYENDDLSNTLHIEKLEQYLLL